MESPELIKIIEDELHRSSTSESSEFQLWRRDAADYYKLTPKGDHKEGNSDAESPDVQSIVDQTISQIMPRFQREMLAEFQELGPEDAEQAKAESEAINTIVLHKCDGYSSIRSALFDALLQGLGAAIVYWDSSERVIVQEIDPEMKDMVKLQADLSGQDIEIITSDDKTLVRTRVPKGELIIKPLPLDTLRLSSDAECLNPDKHRFIGYEGHISTKELMDLGIDPEVILELPDAEDDDDIEADEYEDSRTLMTAHESNANKKFVECWYFIDYDGDGRAERRHIRYSGTEMLLNEEVSDEVDIVLGTGMHQPHRPYGWSYYLKEKTVQDVKREVLRQAIDSGRLAIDQRWIAEKGAINLKTMTHSRPGGIVFAEPGKIDGIKPLSAPDGMGSALPLMTYMDKIRSEVGGNALDMSGENSPVPGSTAHGVERIITSREQMVAEISETFARSFLKRLFVVAHRVLRREGAPVPIDVNGQRMMVSASQFPERDEVLVNMGPTMSQRAMRQQALTLMLDRMMSPEVQGMGLTTPDRIHQALVDLGDSYELPDSSRYWLDPNSDEAQMRQQQAAQQPPPPEVQQQMAMQEQQLQLQAQQQEIVQAQLRLEYLKAGHAAKNDEEELRFKYYQLGVEDDQKADDQDIEEDKVDLMEEELALKYGYGGQNG